MSMKLKDYLKILVIPENKNDYEVQHITPIVDLYALVAVKTRELEEDCAIGKLLNLVWDKDKVSHVSRWDKSLEKVLLVNVVISKVHA